jgi:hypothetical protein
MNFDPVHLISISWLPVQKKYFYFRDWQIAHSADSRRHLVLRVNLNPTRSYTLGELFLIGTTRGKKYRVGRSFLYWKPPGVIRKSPTSSEIRDLIGLFDRLWVEDVVAI